MVGLSLARAVRSRTGPNYIVCAIGVALLLMGVLDRGLADAVALSLLALGAAVTVLGAVFGRLSEFEIGPGGLKSKLARDDGEFRPVFVAESARLQRFAKLMCGDGEQARELVEEALTRTRQQNRAIPPEERGAFALRTLITLLETAGVRSWLRGQRLQPAMAPDTEEVVSALATLDVPTRAAFILHFDWALGFEELAALLRRPAGEIEDAVRAAKAEVAP